MPNMKVNYDTNIHLERNIMTKSTKKIETAVKAPRKSRAKNNVVITETEATAILDAAAENPSDLRSIVKDVKKRKPSTRERGEEGKVIRKGRNLSGNMPFQAKLYFYDLEFAKGVEYDLAYNAAPMQVRLILKYMRETGITTADDAERGGEIAGGAINSKYLDSKIDPPALFAYYRRVMERLGLRLAETSGMEDEG